jgi:hypothetical protein
MNKTRKISLAATLFIIAIVIAGSAFIKLNPDNKKQVTYDYFQYNSINYTEGAYETSGNWGYIGTSNPGSNPCSAGTSHSCVVKVDHSQLSTDPSLTMPQKVALFLQGRPGITGASDYVNSSSNYTYRKP